MGGEAAAAVHRGGAVKPPDLVRMLGHRLAAGPEQGHDQGVAAGEDVALDDRDEGGGEPDAAPDGEDDDRRAHEQLQRLHHLAAVVHALLEVQLRLGLVELVRLVPIRSLLVRPLSWCRGAQPLGAWVGLVGLRCGVGLAPRLAPIGWPRGDGRLQDAPPERASPEGVQHVLLVLRVAPTEGLAAPHAPELVEEAHLTSRHLVHLEGGHGLLLLLVRLELVVVDRGNGGASARAQQRPLEPRPAPQRALRRRGSRLPARPLAWPLARPPAHLPARPPAHLPPAHLPPAHLPPAHSPRRGRPCRRRQSRQVGPRVVQRVKLVLVESAG